MENKIIIIGGGAAGIFAAIGALEKGVKPLIIEKMPRLGTKLLITGKGRCNLTNAADNVEYFIDNMPGNGTFLYSALYTFSNTQLLQFLNNLGLKTKVERGGRVFPTSDKAIDLVNTLSKYLNLNGIKVLLNTPVQKLMTSEGKITGVKTVKEEFFCEAVILATGGASYPRTGSSGDGYRLAKEVGHSIISPKPALVPLETVEKWPQKIKGLTLKNVEVTISNNSKKIAREFGEMLFTHFGVSGPIILTLSRKVVDEISENKQVKIHINLKPALSFEQLDKRLLRDFQKYNRKQFKNSLNDLLPRKLIDIIIELSGISPEKVVNQITREEREKLAQLILDLQLTVKKSRPLSEAIVTAGGIDVNEIDPSTMESKIISGLFFGGEIMDIDGYTGGFNLQAAFSTGYLSGISAANFLKT